MALNRYRFSYANIPQAEFESLCERIDAWSYNGIQYNWQEKIAEFSLDENESPDVINIPAYCHLVRIL